MKKRGNTIEDKENNNRMDRLNLSDNIIRLRRERKITQEELADFLGVSKAAVSKWENAQSTPDLMLLLELSAYFGTTIDELIGYKAQLSKEQIRRFYAELVKDFARLPFHEAIEKTRTLAHREYRFPEDTAAFCKNRHIEGGKMRSSYRDCSRKTGGKQCLLSII